MKNKRILYISDLYSPYIIGGAERIAEKDANHFKILPGYEVGVLTTNPLFSLKSIFPYKRTLNSITKYSYYPLGPYFGTENIAKIPRIIKGFTLFQGTHNFFSQIMAYKVFKDFKPDIIHSNYILYLSYGILKKIKVPIVHTFHDYLFECPKGTYYRTNGEICSNPYLICKARQHYFKKIFSNVSKIIVLNKFTHRRLIDLGYNKSKIIYLPNGIKIPNAPPNYVLKENIILYIGQLTEIKGVSVLIKAFNKITNDNWKLKIIGKGDSLNDLKKIRRNTNIEFLGYVEKTDFVNLLKTSKILVCPSVYRDPFPTVNLEAMIHGLALIGSNTGGIADVIDHGKNGYLFKVGDSDDLKEKMESLIADESKLEKFCKKSWERVNLHYNSDRRFEILEKIYKDLLIWNGSHR